MNLEPKSRWKHIRTVLARDFKLILTVLLILSAIGAVDLIFIGSEREIGEIMSRPRDNRYSISLEGNKATGINKKGEIVWKIESDRVTLSINEEYYEFHGAHAVFYDKKGPNLDIEVGKIIYHVSTENLDLIEGIKIVTRDNMRVETGEVYWVNYRNMFVFPSTITLETSEGNWVRADYMHGDKDLRQMFFIGNCQIMLHELTDTEFIDERKLTAADLKLEDFKNVFAHADLVYYDKEEEVMVITSSFSDKKYEVMNPKTKKLVEIDYGGEEPRQIYFRKDKIEIFANHLEVHMKESWAKCYGNVDMILNPDEIDPDDDPSLKAMKRRTTRIHANDIEYFWDIDYARTYGRTVVTQEDRRAGAWGVTYYGKFFDEASGQQRKIVFLDDEVFIYQGSGKWLEEDELIKDFKNPDIQNMLYEEIKLTAGRAVLFLDSNDIYASNGVRIRQKDKVAECGETFYDDTLKKFTCQKNVSYYNKKDETFVGEQIIFFTDKDDIEVNGRIEANIKVPEKYITEFDDVGKKLKERGSKGTTDEERVREEESEKARERRENPQWEFLPSWEDAVMKQLHDVRGLRQVPDAPTPEFGREGTGWLRKLTREDLFIAPWLRKDGERDKDEEPARGREVAPPRVPQGVSPPEGEPMAPPQISGLTGDKAVRALREELGLEGRPVRNNLPPGEEFVPPPMIEGRLPGFDGQGGGDPLEFTWKLSEDDESETEPSAPPLPPEGEAVPEDDSRSQDDERDAPSDAGDDEAREEGDAILIGSPREEEG